MADNKKLKETKASSWYAQRKEGIFVNECLLIQFGVTTNTLTKYKTTRPTIDVSKKND